MVEIKTKPKFFATPDDFRAWLEKNHVSAQELWVGFHKRDTGKPSITWPESVDCALSFGWIDGIRKRIDDESYAIRFTPRRSDSNWSLVNIKRVRDLTKLGLMREAGIKAFSERKKAQTYSYEQRENAEFDTASERLFRANRKGWEFFQAQAPWYRRAATHWVVSAKKEETRAKRLMTLIEASARGRRLGS